MITNVFWLFNRAETLFPQEKGKSNYNPSYCEKQKLRNMSGNPKNLVDYHPKRMALINSQLEEMNRIYSERITLKKTGQEFAC